MPLAAYELSMDKASPVPVAPFAVAHHEKEPPDCATQEVLPEPSVDSTYPLVPAPVGSFIVHVPAASATESVTVPDVVPLNSAAPVVPHAVPIVTVEASVGAVPNTSFPLHVSSDIIPASCAEVVAANTERLSDTRATFVPPDWSFPVPFGTRFMLMFELDHVAVCVADQVPPAIWK